MTKTTLLTALALICLLAGCGQSAASPTVEPIPTTPPTATNVLTAAPTATTPPTATAVASPTPQDLASALDALMNGLVEEGRFSGAVLIARDGEVLLKKGYGFADRETELPNTPQTRFRIASITKLFTAMGILLLEAQGKLDVQDSICDYVPDCPEEWQPVTIHHLLTHTSGISSDSGEGGTFSPERMIEDLKRVNRSPQPGEEFSYSAAGYKILGYIIEQESGQTYEEFLQEQVFDPLGMQDSGYDHNRDDLAVGYFNSRTEAGYMDMDFRFSAGGLYSTVEDLYRWDQALYTERLVSSEYLARMFTEQALANFQTAFGGSVHSGYGWFIVDDRGRKAISHMGRTKGFAGSIARYHDDKVTIIFLGNQEDLVPAEIHDLLPQRIFNEE